MIFHRTEHHSVTVESPASTYYIIRGSSTALNNFPHHLQATTTLHCTLRGVDDAMTSLYSRVADVRRLSIHIPSFVAPIIHRTISTVSRVILYVHRQSVSRRTDATGQRSFICGLCSAASPWKIGNCLLLTSRCRMLSRRVERLLVLIATQKTYRMYFVDWKEKQRKTSIGSKHRLD